MRSKKRNISLAEALKTGGGEVEDSVVEVVVEVGLYTSTFRADMDFNKCTPCICFILII